MSLIREIMGGKTEAVDTSHPIKRASRSLQNALGLEGQGNQRWAVGILFDPLCFSSVPLPSCEPPPSPQFSQSPPNAGDGQAAAVQAQSKEPGLCRGGAKKHRS